MINPPRALLPIQPQQPRPPPPVKAPRFINAYIMFSTSQRSIIAQQHPNLNTVQISKIMGDQWRSMTDHDKQHYEDLAKKENAKRQAEFASKQQKQQEPSSTALANKNIPDVRPAHFGPIPQQPPVHIQQQQHPVPMQIDQQQSQPKPLPDSNTPGTTIKDSHRPLQLAPDPIFPALAPTAATQFSQPDISNALTSSAGTSTPVAPHNLYPPIAINYPPAPSPGATVPLQSQHQVAPVAATAPIFPPTTNSQK
mmetsp:Transcript_14064/g.16990  ORF Transcript_14064/g.16990 Transcript_14064/m.16990 type:complete len:253 (+) Transcript_14064:1-759(+)|eukprot:CAMPEP_0197288596 /NCGR_PEP_ID=MMETSP0890-20130614/5741_1 /TAXON_ID=44058 ORGANISM="Aureoumbra lagunensis, Strain CCMP1510" /NCGR_SAMPLE_ID=MMETSP0890 /ASSEMBLY_ACC=CAM_ASM_000533 /LENGTH=252 /DNA_ID=CAMNT_0042759447 /DNA_START=1 /DNA_END=759 /DNA_ORIENTATION=-